MYKVFSYEQFTSFRVHNWKLPKEEKQKRILKTASDLVEMAKRNGAGGYAPTEDLKRYVCFLCGWIEVGPRQPKPGAKRKKIRIWVYPEKDSIKAQLTVERMAEQGLIRFSPSGKSFTMA